MESDPIAKPYKLGPHLVAGIWQYMLPAELASMTLPAERHATCMRCPKVVSNDFREDYRCCTYFPRVPNFLVGLALIHQKGAAQLPLQKMIEQGFMTPEGMIPSPKKWALYVSEVGRDLFGRSQELLCPLLDSKTGFCGIYAFRNSVCSTFFCHNDNGKPGETFWDSIQTLASQCELALGQWAMDELGFSTEAYMQRLNKVSPSRASTLSSPFAWSKEVRAYLWGEWFGREEAFLRATGQLIADHRNELWQIANNYEILEASRFEKKSLNCIPPAYRDQADEDGSMGEEEGETVAPTRLWRDVQKAYARMMALPGGPLTLNRRVTIIANPCEDPEEHFYQTKPFVVRMHRRAGSHTIEWREFIDHSTAELLAEFIDAQQLSTPRLQGWQTLLGVDPLPFIAEWYGKKVLRSVAAT